MDYGEESNDQMFMIKEQTSNNIDHYVYFIYFNLMTFMIVIVNIWITWPFCFTFKIGREGGGPILLLCSILHWVGLWIQKDIMRVAKLVFQNIGLSHVGCLKLFHVGAYNIVLWYDNLYYSMQMTILPLIKVLSIKGTNKKIEKVWCLLLFLP